MLENNLYKLKAFDPAAAEKIRSAPADPEIEFITSRNGDPSAVLHPAGRAEKLVYSRFDPRKQSGREASLFVNSLPAPPDKIAVLGLGLGYHLEHLAQLFPAARFIVFERRPALARAAFVRADFSELIDSGRLKLILGETPPAAAPYCPPETAIFHHPALFDAEMEYYFPILRAIKNPSPGKRLRVISFITRGSALPFALADCREAFLALGHEVRLVDLRDVRRERENTDAAADAVMQFAPDMIFTIDVAGLVPALHSRLGIPLVSWFFDNPLSFLESRASGREAVAHYVEDLGNDYWIFTWDRSYIDELRQRGARRVEYLPFAANPNIFKPVELTEEQRAQYCCDVSFAGNSGWDGDEWYRRRMIRKLAGLNVHVYGDEGWKSVADGGVEYRGHADNRTDLPLLYNASAVNLNLTDVQLKTALPIRVFDVLAAGGFLVSDYRDDLAELFAEGRELVCCRDMDTLRDVVEHYLARPGERRAIGAAGRTRILSEHTYIKRIEYIISRVFSEKQR